MQTAEKLHNESEKSTGTGNRYIQNKSSNNRQNVRTTDPKKMAHIFLNDPYSVTRDEFLLFQSAIGYQQAAKLLAVGKRRKSEKLAGKSAKTPTVQKIQSQSTSKSHLKAEADKRMATGAALPDELRSGLENLSGIDLSNVSVHKNSNKPAQLDALAYTKGNDIHIAHGQEKHLPHEAWHVVQQMQGRVKPSLKMKTETHVNYDYGLEKEADIMGNKAASKSTQSNLQMKKPSLIESKQHGGNVIQKKGFFGNVFSGAEKLAGNIVKQGAKLGKEGFKAASNVVKQGAKLGASGLKAVSKIVKLGAKAGEGGLKTVGNIVKQAAKTGVAGLKTASNIVKQGAKAGKTGLKAVSKIVKQGVKAGAGGLKTVGNIVKQAAKTGAAGLKAASNIVKQGAKAGKDGLKATEKIANKGPELFSKVLKVANNAANNAANKGPGLLKSAFKGAGNFVDKGLERANKFKNSFSGMSENLSKRVNKYIDKAFNGDVIKSAIESSKSIIKDPGVFIDGIKEIGKNGIQFTKSLYKNLNKNDNIKLNKKIMSAARDTSAYKNFVSNTQKGGEFQTFLECIGGFDRDKNGVYHAQQNALQQYGGYNNFYDGVFDFATSMDVKKYPFSVGNEEYIIWLWKGDYMNLGAGAETGIYSGGEPQWDAGVEYAMPMTLSLKDKDGNKIFDWDPKKNNWWCTGFNPEYQNANAKELIAHGTIDFSKDKLHRDMYEAFKKEYYDNPVWEKFDDKNYTATFTWKSK